MRDRTLRTLTEAADELGVNPRTVTDLLRIFKIETHATGLPGKSKGLSPAQIADIRFKLGINSRAEGRPDALSA